MNANILNQIDEAIESAKEMLCKKITIHVEARLFLTISSPPPFRLLKQKYFSVNNYTIYVMSKGQMEECVLNIKNHYQNYNIEIQPVTSSPFRTSIKINISWKNNDKKGDIHNDSTT